LSEGLNSLEGRVSCTMRAVVFDQPEMSEETQDIEGFDIYGYVS
jgi:hypothetical protein